MTPEQEKWLKKAAIEDLLRAKIIKKWDFKQYKEIEGAWKQLNEKGQQRLSEKWFHPDGWR